jgi:alcohol dehydrogenase
VIDYKTKDLCKLDYAFDMIFDAVGLYKKSVCKNLLAPGGLYKSVMSTAKHTEDGLKHLSRLIEQGLVKPVIDRVYDWEAIQEAHRYVDQGHKAGNVVIKVIK